MNPFDVLVLVSVGNSDKNNFIVCIFKTLYLKEGVADWGIMSVIYRIYATGSV
jgi:hypothetical protein